jgi:RimJ/RimL family protein N-acetyltransferase
MKELHGKQTVIRATAEDDLPNIQSLWNDGRVMQWVGFPNGLGYDLERMKKWFNHLQADQDCRHFVVHDRKGNFCGELFYRKDMAHKRAALDIKLLPEAQGRGIAAEALKALIRLVFSNEPEINAVWTEPSEENAAARKLYARCGLSPKPRPADLEEWVSYWELRREDWKREIT